MKKYVIEIDDDLSDLFLCIAHAAQRTAEEIIADTLYKMADIISKKLDEQ